MAYEKQFFTDGNVLTAQQLNRMEEGIQGAYFTTDNNMTLDKGKLSVNFATDTNRTLPISAEQVDRIVGNIEILLETV